MTNIPDILASLDEDTKEKIAGAEVLVAARLAAGLCKRGIIFQTIVDIPGPPERFLEVEIVAGRGIISIKEHDERPPVRGVRIGRGEAD